jgi:hypothetical protein
MRTEHKGTWNCTENLIQKACINHARIDPRDDGADNYQAWVDCDFPQDPDSYHIFA